MIGVLTLSPPCIEAALRAADVEETLELFCLVQAGRGAEEHSF